MNFNFPIKNELNIEMNIRSRKQLLLFYCRKRGDEYEYGKSKKSIKIYML